MQKIERKDVRAKPAVSLPAVESSEELPRSRSNTQARLADKNCQGVRVDALWCSDDFAWGTVIPSHSKAYFKEKPCFGDLPFCSPPCSVRGCQVRLASLLIARQILFLRASQWQGPGTPARSSKVFFLTWRLFNNSVSYTYNMVKSDARRGGKSCSGCQECIDPLRTLKNLKIANKHKQWVFKLQKLFWMIYMFHKSYFYFMGSLIMLKDIWSN